MNQEVANSPFGYGGPTAYQEPKSKEVMISEEIGLKTAAPAGQKTIVFRAVHGKQQGPLTLFPARIGLTDQMKGVKILSEDEKRVAKRVVTWETSRKITDGFFLDLSSETDKVDVEWILHCDEIAMSLHEAQQSKNALYYIEDVTKDLADRVTSRKRKYEAVDLIYKASPDDLHEITRLFGQQTQHWTPNQIIDFLTDRVDTSPKGADEVIDKFTNKDRKILLFFYQLKDQRVIYFRNGMYYYENIALGSNQDRVIQYLQERDNIEVVTELYRIVNPVTKKPNAVHTDLMGDLERRVANPESFGASVSAPARTTSVDVNAPRKNPWKEQDHDNANHFARTNPDAVQLEPEHEEPIDTDFNEEDLIVDGHIGTPADATEPKVDTRSKQQKAADTRKANKNKNS